MELLAKKQLAIRDKQGKIVDEIGEFDAEAFNEDIAYQVSYQYYSTTTKFDWGKKEEEECREWLNKTLNYNDAFFNPKNQKILKVERYFDN